MSELSNIWFGVSVLYVLKINKEETKRWEESIILVDAQDSDIEEKAILLAKKQEVEYLNSDGELCEWIFVGISACYQIDDNITDGCEVFSRFLRQDEAKSLLEPYEK